MSEFKIEQSYKILNDFFPNGNIQKYLILFNMFPPKEYVLEKRGNIVGIKKNNERLRIYVEKNGCIRFPLINKKYMPYDITDQMLNEYYLETQKYCESNDISLRTKKVDSSQNFNNEMGCKPHNLHAKPYYDYLSKAISSYIVKTKRTVTKEDIYLHFKNKKKRTLFNAIRYGKNVLYFPHYIESMDKMIFYESEICLLKENINFRLKNANYVDVNKLFNEYRKQGILLRNGIDSKCKFYELLFKLYMNDFIFYKSGYLISLEPIIDKKSDNQQINEEFSMEKELMKYIELEDIKNDI